MKFVSFILILCFSVANVSFAQKASFDKKPICLEQKGNWRKFASGCAGSCRAKFDPFTMCAHAIIFSCDCGEDRCWNKDKCVSQKEYKKEFDKENKQREEEMAKRRKERLERFNSDPQYANHIKNLYPRPNTVGQNGKKNNSKNKPVPINKKQEVAKESTRPIIRQIPPAYMQNEKIQAINSDGKPQDLAFPVVPLP